MIDRSEAATVDEGPAAVPSAHGPGDPATGAASMRQLALHQETARLLELRAARAATDAQAVLLRRRAEQHRRIAHRIRQELGAALRRVRIDPSAADA